MKSQSKFLLLNSVGKFRVQNSLNRDTLVELLTPAVLVQSKMVGDRGGRSEGVSVYWSIVWCFTVRLLYILTTHLQD